MVLEEGLSERIRHFLFSKEGFDCFMPKNKTEKDIINAIVKSVCTDEEPILYKEEDLDEFKKTDLKKNEGIKEAPEYIEAYAFVGLRGALVALKEVVTLTTSLFVCGENLGEVYKDQSIMLVQDKARGIAGGIHKLQVACVIGDSLNEMGQDLAGFETRQLQRGKELLGANMYKGFGFQSKIETLLFKAYKFIFIHKPENPKLQEQDKLREEIASLNKQINKEALALMEEQNHKCTIAIPLVVSILNKQNLEAQAYIKLSKLHDTQLLINEFQFFKTKFRKIGLVLADQLIRSSLLLGMEVATGGFAFCEGGIMFIGSLASSAIKQPLRSSAEAVFLPFLRSVARLIG